MFGLPLLCSTIKKFLTSVKTWKNLLDFFARWKLLRDMLKVFVTNRSSFLVSSGDDFAKATGEENREGEAWPVVKVRSFGRTKAKEEANKTDFSKNLTFFEESVWIQEQHVRELDKRSEVPLSMNELDGLIQKWYKSSFLFLQQAEVLRKLKESMWNKDSVNEADLCSTTDDSQIAVAWARLTLNFWIKVTSFLFVFPNSKSLAVLSYAYALFHRSSLQKFHTRPQASFF